MPAACTRRWGRGRREIYAALEASGEGGADFFRYHSGYSGSIGEQGA